MPLLAAGGASYYNPQVEEWSPDLVAIEQAAKTRATIVLFIIDGTTRSLASMVECAELICSGRNVVTVIQDVEDGQEIAGSKVTGRELKDLNRARTYLSDVAARFDLHVFTD